MSGRIPPRRLAPVLFSALLLLSLAGLLLGLLPAATPASAHAPRAALAPRARAAGAPSALFASTFIVNTTGDGSDSNTADNVCDDGTGHCTLRAAIQQANATAGTDTISFNIPGAGLHTITPASALPAVTEAVVIDGYTQPGSSQNTLAGGDDAVIEIELDGTNAGASTSGLVISAGGSTVRGLAVNRFGTGGTTSVTSHGTGLELNGDGNTVEGCFVGTDPTGTLPLPNINDGVGVTGNGNTVGGSTPAARNILSGNDREGLLLLSTSSANNVFGNYIGTDLNGAAALSNGAGVVIFGLSNNNRVGGVNAGEGNLISGNLDSGVRLVNTAHDNLVRGNLIGTNAGGAVPLPNQNDGVQLFDTSSNNKIGGTSAAAANVISGNSRDGVRVGSTGAGNVVSRNFIGVAGNGSDSASNGEDGVRVDGGANLTVGGATTASSNIIAFNAGRGVNLTGGATAVNIAVNSIRDNGTLGVDLAGDGVTPNDAGDADAGENGLQNFPVITSAAEFGQNVSVAGTLNSAANSAYTLRFFASSTCDASGNGQGASFVGSGTVKTDGAGNASFSFYFENAVASGDQITATATDSAGDTSEFSACFAAAAVTACGAGRFAAATSFAAGNSPISVAVGDFNGDGKRDLALTDQNSSSVSVLLGDGAGGFTASNNFTVGADPLSVVVADFDGDGHQDLATANRNSNNLSVLLGDGAGNFSAATNFNTGTSPDGIVAADFNNDGKLDLAVSNGGTNNVSVLLGDGAGSFGAATNFAIGDSPNALAVGDFNNDGNPDVVTVNFFNNTASVLLGDGAGGLGTATSFTVGTLPLSVAVGDFNGDGNQDIVTANRGTSNVSVLFGDGAGGFSAANNVATGSGPVSVAVGDINGDGNEDIVTADLFGGTASVLPGDGAGNFGDATSFAAGVAPQSVAASDFNGDGKPDLAVANNTSNNVAVLVSNCTPPAGSNFVVNSTGDGPDTATDDPICDDGTGHCTLRAAIMESNGHPGTDTISFNIPGAGLHTISPSSPLPAVTEAVVIDGYTQPGSSPNTLAGGDDAVIEIELDGTNAGASTSGLVISAGGSTVRGLAVNRFGSVGNTHGDGIEVTTNGNTVEGCFLGTNPAGTAAAANANHGVLISDASNNLVGGSTPAARNLISGNSQDGVFVADTGGGATGNFITGNFIGTDATGNSSLGNGASGVAFSAARNNTVGGTAAGAANAVAFNGHGGIVVGSGTGDAALSNSVHDNAGLGIDLGDDGVTPNDAGDADTGANNLQNFPLLTAADTSGGSTTIQGTLDSAANTIFRVEFFSNPACDASGSGEGHTLIGSANATTDASGRATISATFAVALSPSDRLTATATSAGGDTSEFSPCLAPNVTANWTGAVSSDWHTAGNWDTGTVPTAANPVRIPSAGVTNEPTISAADAAAASVTIQSGRILSINSGRTLTAATVAVNSGGGLNVGASQTGTVNAALTVDGTLSGGAGATFVFAGASLTNNGTVSVPALQFGGASQTLGGAGAVTSASVVLTGSTVALASDEQLGTLSVQGGATFDQGASFNLTLGGLVVNSGGLFKNLGTGGLTLAGDVSNSGTVQLNGGGAACGDADSILIRSSADGTQRAWSGAGTFSLADVDVRDQAGTANVVVLSGTSSGDNGPNWKFETCGGILQTFSISGRVADASNQPLVGVNVHLGGSLAADTTTDSNGNYTFSNLTQGGSYDLTPTEVNFRFAPTSSAVSNLQADRAGVNFTGSFLDHTITGLVVDAQSNPLPGVTVTLAGSFSAVAHTDAQGRFTFNDIPESGSFVVTPEREGFTFDPAHQSITNVSADVQFQAVGTAQPSPTPTPDQSDDFSGGPDPNPDKWVRGILTNPPADFDPLVQVFLAGGLLHIQPRPDANGPSYSGLISVRALDLNSTPVVSIEAVQAARGAGTQTIFGLGRDSDNWFRFSVAENAPSPTPTPTPPSTPTPTPTASPTPTPNASPTPTTSPTPSGPSSSKAGAGADTTGQTLFFEFSVGGNKFSTGIAYNPAQQRFWRFRHDAPAHLLIFETSPDAANWTERFRATLPPDQTALIAELSAGTFLPSHTPGEALFDNFLISPSPQLQFANPTFSASESAGSAQVQVIRTGSAESPDAVDFATSDGTARAGRDYTVTSGTLVFNVGERLKTISVPLINNDARDGDRTFNVTLSNPVGGRLGSITRAAVNILDDDAQTNRLDDTTFFVTQHYLDFLGRAPDADGLRFWTNNIDSCGANAQCREVKRIDTSAAFFLSIEFQETGYVVERFYEASFGRPPKFAEYLPDLSALREGVIVGQPGAEDRLALNKELFAEQWVTRPEFKQAFGTLNDEQYVDTLAANAGVHLAEEDRTAFIVGLLTDRETRAGVLLQIVENSDFKQRDFNAAFVRMEYFGYLRRDPDPSGFNFWLNKLNSFGGDFRRAEMVKAFLSSSEYRARFGQP